MCVSILFILDATNTARDAFYSNLVTPFLYTTSVFDVASVLSPLV